MQETARQQYLDAMGIQTYMPKWVLPSAPIPRQCDLASLRAPHSNLAEVSSTIAASVPEPVSNQGQNLVASIPETVGNILQSMLSSARSAEPTKSTGKNANLSLLAKQQLSASQEQAFSVNLWQFTGLIVIADRLVQKALPVNVLLKNIVIALGRSMSEAQKPEVIKWPLEGLSGAQSGPADTYLKSILLARRFADQPTTLLCFGELSRRHLMAADAALNTVATVALSDTEQMPAVSLPSLEALIESPHLKAAVWAAILHLRIS